MPWDFSTDPEWAAQLAWVDGFVRSECEPVDLLVKESHDLNDPVRQALIPPLQKIVKERGLWATHLGSHLGGPGYGQLKLALLNEILGRSECAPIVFGSQAPDSGNSEILAHYGTPELKKRYLEPLLDNRIVSCFSMTEPQGGADPGVFTTRAEKRGGEWVINGEKWFASNAKFASFFIVMVVTDPGAPLDRRMSQIIVPAGTPGLEIVRNVAYGEHVHDTHSYLRFTDVRVPAENLLGKAGDGFVVAQVRLGGGRIHHAMRTIAQAKKAFDMMCERVLSRSTKGEVLSEKQMVQDKIADSWIELEQFRLLVLRTAWLIDKHHDYKRVRKDISAVKVAMPVVLHNIAGRALHLHGSIGLSNEMPFASMVVDSYFLGLADGPTEVHKATMAKLILRDYKPTNALFPSYHLPQVREHAAEIYREALETAGVA